MYIQIFPLVGGSSPLQEGIFVFDLFDLIQQSFSYTGTGLPGSNQYLARINVLAQGHNAVTPVRLEPAAPRSRVKHSTTEPLRSLGIFVYSRVFVQ